MTNFVQLQVWFIAIKWKLKLFYYLTLTKWHRPNPNKSPFRTILSEKFLTILLPGVQRSSMDREFTSEAKENGATVHRPAQGTTVSPLRQHDVLAAQIMQIYADL